MPKNLVIVESPAKAKTLKKFLGSAYKIEASVGHVRDLPKSELGVDIENDFEPKYITIRGKGGVLAKLRKEVKNAEKVYLATDPDREGEAISWHLAHALKLDEKNTYRITFNEITKNAVKNSLKQARAIDMNLVDAQQARRSLDRIVGYKIGPLLWKKVKKGLSAGRVQSVGLKIICDREEEAESFIREEYWTVDAALSVKVKNRDEKFTARLTGNASGKIELKSKEQTDRVLADLQKEDFNVTEIKKGQRVKKPNAPFITSTLQQEASKVLGFATNKTMMVAQQLYEGVEIKPEGTVGLISYVRTDSVRISDEAHEAAKEYIVNTYGKDYLSPERVIYKSKGRSQDAHEAIRPTYIDKTPDSLKSDLSKEQFKLYKLIWERFISSEMSPAVYDTLSVKIKAGEYRFSAGGSALNYDGYLLVYKKNETETEEEAVKIPALNDGDKITVSCVNGGQHFTQPPPRYTEAALVKALEELGIGRPSTYSAIISILISRRYITKEAKTLCPTELGLVINDIMENNFQDIVDIDFTANLENKLDLVEGGEIGWKDILRDFYPSFNEEILKADSQIGEVDIADEVTDVICENCGRNMVIKFGRYGKFLACPGFPECRNAKSFFEEAGVSCPLCENGDVLIKKTKKGRMYFGCSNNPECAFYSWNKPSGEFCPECGSYLVIKKSKNKGEARAVCSGENCSFHKDFELEAAE